VQEITAGEEARIRDAYARRAAARPGRSPFEPGQLFTVQQIERRMLALLRREGLAPLAGRKILEVGCGNGYWLCDLIKWGAEPHNLTGVDLLERRIDEARARCAAGVRLRRANAAGLPYAAESFDVILQSTMFTSVLDPALKRALAAEMMRLVKPDGVILWYDLRMDNPRNPDVRGIESREIRDLFSGCQVRLRRITLAPPLARRLAPLSWIACYLLEHVPWLCTHYLGIIRKQPFKSFK
jgi:SAM-dependent methyltransferase